MTEVTALLRWGGWIRSVWNFMDLLTRLTDVCPMLLVPLLLLMASCFYRWLLVFYRDQHSTNFFFFLRAITLQTKWFDCLTHPLKHVYLHVSLLNLFLWGDQLACMLLSWCFKSIVLKLLSFFSFFFNSVFFQPREFQHKSGRKTSPSSTALLSDKGSVVFQPQENLKLILLHIYYKRH